MHNSNLIYTQDKTELHGFLAYDDSKSTPRPAVIVAHDWSGRNEFACKKAQMLAQMGYVGFALDMYGQGKLGSTQEQKQALIQPLLQDRSLLGARVRAALDALSGVPQVDTQRVAIIGFCFGGLCALDLARSGAAIKAAVSFHGILLKPENLTSKTIDAKVLVLHGYDDPMVKPEQVIEFCKEMDQARADWQVHMYGHVEHAFTNPEAHDEKAGLIYNAQASQRAWQAMENLLTEVFN